MAMQPEINGDMNPTPMFQMSNAVRIFVVELRGSNEAELLLRFLLIC